MTSRTTAPCPDWAALARERDRAERSREVGGAAVDDAWAEALRHREDCGRCRADALRTDPLFLFRGDFARGDDEDLEAGEVDRMLQRVRLELDNRAAQKRLNRARSTRRRRGAALAIAAGAAAAALGVSLLSWPAAAPPAENAAADAPLLPAHIAMAPLVETLGDAPMQVYQLPGGGPGAGLDVVLVVAP